MRIRWGDNRVSECFLFDFSKTKRIDNNENTIWEGFSLEIADFDNPEEPHVVGEVNRGAFASEEEEKVWIKNCVDKMMIEGFFDFREAEKEGKIRYIY